MFAAMLAALLVQTASPPTPPPPACTGPEHRQFDFWVGEWTVTPTGKANVVASSLIEKLYGGCAVRENWMPLKGTAGGSLNNYYDGQWRQTWVDAANSRVDFTGGLVDGKMVMTGEGGSWARQGRADPHDLFEKCRWDRPPAWRAVDRRRQKLVDQFRRHLSPEGGAIAGDKSASQAGDSRLHSP